MGCALDHVGPSEVGRLGFANSQLPTWQGGGNRGVPAKSPGLGRGKNLDFKAQNGGNICGKKPCETAAKIKNLQP